MRKKIDPVNEAYNAASIKLADAYHRMSEIYEEWSGKERFENMELSDLDLALKWEKMSLESRRRHSDTSENIKAGENNIRRIRAKIKEYKENRRGDNKFGNT
ncbi:MAG: hypothetical protein WC788_01315 [Candidatus Paceibacterota bacterium]|jgi:hypothetical protein